MSLQVGGSRKLVLFIQSLILLSVPAAYGQVRPRVVEAVDNTRRVTLAGNLHPLARAEFERGAVADAQPMTRMLLLLKRSEEQETALQDYLEKQQDKSSPSYHAWLAPDEFGAEYGPADADIQAVTGWLGSQGFTVEKVYSGKTVIEFSGTAGQVQTAFGAAIRNYEVAGKTYVANANDPQIPAALAPVVVGIVSLNNFPRQSHARIAGTARKIAGKAGLEPLFTFPNPFGSGSFYGVAPGDFATIYNSNPLLKAATPIDGTGQTIAIVGETNINVADVQAFRQIFGLPATFVAANVILNGEDPGITSPGEEAEADLDTQWSGAVAPGATVDLVVSASTPASQGVDLSALYIIEHNLAAVMSESYGQCESSLLSAGNAFYNSLWEQAAAQGITAVVSSGDNGSTGCDDPNSATVATGGLAVSGLASTPYNVAVGGTDFDEANNGSQYWSPNNSATGTSALSYIPEIPWNQSCAQLGLTGCGASAPNGSVNIVAASGGPSSRAGKPAWQLGVTGMPNDNHRDLPDVSLFASPGFDGSGYIVCAGNGAASGPSQCFYNSPNSYNFAIIGGTSASAPAFAGVMALVNQKQVTIQNPAPRQGNANYVLYALAKKQQSANLSCNSSTVPAAACTFNDVTKGNSYLLTKYGSSVGTNSVACQGASPNCSSKVAGINGVLVDPAHTTTEAWTATAGYEMATGLGSMNINNLATNWGTVSTVPTTTTLSLTPMTGIPHGTTQSVAVNITVTPTTATGNVSLIATMGPNGTTTQGLDVFTLATNGNVTGTTHNLPGGTYAVTAHYAGDGTNAPSDSAPKTVTVGQESSHTFIVIPTFDSNGNQLNGNASSVVYGSNYIIRMYVTDTNGTGNPTGPPSPVCYQENLLTCPTGTVTLTNSGVGVGTGGGGAGIYNLNNAGYTRDITPNLTGGTYVFAASYGGDNSYLGSTSAAVNFTVTPVATQLEFTNGPRGLVGSPITLAMLGIPNVSAGATPTGTLSVYDGSTLIAGPLPVAPVYSGQNVPPLFSASAQVTFTTGGDHSLTAQYSGDANYAAVTSPPEIIHPLYPTTFNIQTSATTVAYGTGINVTATVNTGQKNPAISGQINFSSSSGLDKITAGPTTESTDASGNVMLQAVATLTPQNTESVFAGYTGDANYTSASGSTAQITVNIPDFTLGPASGLSVTPPAGQPGTGQITITPASQTPSTVTLQISQITISGYTIALSPQQINLNGAPATATITLTPAISVPASAVRSHERHAGLFAFKRGNWWLLSLATGVAVLFLLGLPGRRKRYRAALGLGLVCLVCFAIGCGGGRGGGGGGGGGGGTAQATSIALTTTSAKAAQNTPFTITATITSSKPLTGTVTFYNFGTAFTGGASPSGGQAQTGQGPLYFPGVYQVTASYSGDPSNLPSTSAPLIQVITGAMQVTIQGNTGGDAHDIQVLLGVQ